jgi:hypothetical protein
VPEALATKPPCELWPSNGSASCTAAGSTAHPTTNTRFVGLDVHAETIAVAVAEGRGQVRALGTIPNRPEAVRRLLSKLGKASELRACYEAGPTGYPLLLAADGDGHRVRVIAPSLALGSVRLRA